MFGFKRRDHEFSIPRGRAEITMEQAISESEHDGVAAMARLSLAEDGGTTPATGFIPATRRVCRDSRNQRNQGHGRCIRRMDVVNPVNPATVPTIQYGPATTSANFATPANQVERESTETSKTHHDAGDTAPIYRGRHSVARRDDPDMVRARHIAEETHRLMEEKRRKRAMDAAVEREMADVYRSVAEKSTKRVEETGQDGKSASKVIPDEADAIAVSTGEKTGLAGMAPNILPLHGTTDSTIPMSRVPASGIVTRDGYTVVPALVAMRDGDMQTAKIIPFGN